MSNVRVFSAVQTRRKLLLASTAIALAGYLYAPSVFAADECDPIVSNSVTCTSDGNNYASLEAGYLFDTPHLTLSPHARLTYAYAWAEDFDDASGAAIDLKDARSLRGELALRLGKELWQGTSLGSASLELGTRHEFLGEQQAEVSGLTFTDALPGTTAFIAPNLNVELLESSLFLGLRGEYAKGGGSDELSGSLSLNLNL